MSINTTSLLPTETAAVTSTEPMFFVVSVRKLVIMMFFTQGLYLTYWFYKNWKLYRQASGEQVMPVLRSIFLIFFLYALGRAVDRRIGATGRTYSWSPGWRTIGVVLAVLWAIAMPHIDLTYFQGFSDLSVIGLQFLILAFELWLLSGFQRAINYCEADPTGSANNKITGANWVWIVLFLLYWATILFVLWTLMVGLAGVR